ncbi:MAG TPA: hypothetical protein VGL82_09395 [Bryobacteraceae bacterium]
MTGSPKWKVPLSSAWGRSGLIFLLIALAAAIPRLLLGVSQSIEYDGYWDIFIALQDKWPTFWDDIFSQAHPPLYFLLLKATLRFGHSLLIYRSVSLLAGIASVVQVGWIARKVTGSNVRAYQSALVFGLAMPGIIVSDEVRTYTLSVFFVLLSFSCLLGIPGSANSREEGRRRVGFASGAILAFLTHYFAFFYAGAAMAILLGQFAARTYKGAVSSWKAEAATSLPVVAAMYTLYREHASRVALAQQDHLMSFYYDPNGNETVAAFLLRNWKNFVNLFSPHQISADAMAFVVLMLALAGGLFSAAALLRRTQDVSAVRALWTILITAMMLGEFALAALAGKYPFGGDLRQQYLLFPFLTVSGAIVFEQTAGKLSGFVPAYGRMLLNGLAIVAIVWVSVFQFEQYPKTLAKVMADDMKAFDRMEPMPEAVYLDQFNLITFFTFHDDWEWSSLSRQPIPGIHIYRIRRGPEQMLVFRDETQWNFQPDDFDVYSKLAECLRALKVRNLSIFSVRQVPPKPPFSDLKQVKRTIVTLSGQSAICVQRLAVNPIGWYVTFRRTNCAPLNIAPIQVTGAFDDISDDIGYRGSWIHKSFSPASGETVSYSNIAGASARLSFEGSELTYVYTKTFNRGIAQVRLDGNARADIDLYSSRTEWQSRTVFRDLRPGKHTFEVTVSGRKDAGATDRYVDVDALIVH